MITNPMDLSGKLIIVTGASSGIGLGISKFLTGLGARLILVGRDSKRLEIANASLPKQNNVIDVYDLKNNDEIPLWMKKLSSSHGTISGVVHSAGVLPTKPLRLMGTWDWEDAMRINVSAGAALAKGFRQKGVSINGGSIVFISSVMGLAGQPGQVLYSATKGALISMTRSMALELAKENVRVNCVAPAVVATGMSENLQNSMSEDNFASIVRQHPLGLGCPEDVAYAVAFLLADAARWITGTTLVVDGGYTAQ